ncbi:MAG: hypothetical protein NTY67_15650 [Cyanobacteria bacterium]|jgi:hypothetical protein|nr:hypothetical protein [Cyanobacteriota bacterium]
MTATRLPATPSISRPLAPASGLTEPRQHWLNQSARLMSQAADAAEGGNVDHSARLILEALDCERRAGSVGPQVLQLIKPRG